MTCSLVPQLKKKKERGSLGARHRLGTRHNVRKNKCQYKYRRFVFIYTAVSQTKLMVPIEVVTLLALYVCDVPGWSQPVDISGASS